MVLCYHDSALQYGVEGFWFCLSGQFNFTECDWTGNVLVYVSRAPFGYVVGTQRYLISPVLHSLALYDSSKNNSAYLLQLTSTGLNYHQ